MPDPPKTIRTINDYLEAIRQNPAASRAHSHVRFWFRGQSMRSLPLTPGVYRPGFQANNEDHRLDIEQHLTNQFRAQSSGLRDGRDSIEEIYFLQQHYKMPTRLLDWTINPLAALYFATSSKADMGKDGEVFLMDAYKLAPGQHVPRTKFAGVGSQRNLIFKRALKGIFNWGTTNAFPNFIMPISPDYIDARIHAQGGCFTFHPPKKPKLTSDENASLQTLRIPGGSDKQKILRELFLLGVDHFSIFGDLESLSYRLRTAHGIT